MRTIETEIEIAAPAGQVWAILSDTAAYPSWNPFIPRFDGALVEGGRIQVLLKPPGSGGTTLRPTLRRVEPGRELRWLGRLGLPGICDAEHAFTLEPVGEARTLLRQSERFTGVLVPFLGGVLRSTKAGFEEMNRALKERCERR